VDSPVDLGVALRSLAEVRIAGAGGSAPSEATELLKRSIRSFEAIGNDVELARSCRAYAEALRQTSEYRSSPEVAVEAALYARRAEELLSKSRGAAASPTAEVA
jgi:hypothetical protein